MSTTTNFSFTDILSRIESVPTPPTASAVSAVSALSVPPALSKVEKIIRDNLSVRYNDKDRKITVTFKDRKAEVPVKGEDIFAYNLMGVLYRKSFKKTVVPIVKTLFSLGDFMTAEDLPSDEFLESLVPETMFIPETFTSSTFLGHYYKNGLVFTRTTEYVTRSEVKGVQILISKYGVMDEGVLFVSIDEAWNMRVWLKDGDREYLDPPGMDLYDCVDKIIEFLKKNLVLERIGLADFSEENFAMLKVLLYARAMLHVGPRNGPFLRAHYKYLEIEKSSKESLWTTVKKK